MYWSFDEVWISVTVRIFLVCFVPFGLYFWNCVCIRISVRLFYSDDCRLDITQPIWTAEVLKCQPVLTEIKHSCMTVWCPWDKHSLGFLYTRVLVFHAVFRPHPLLIWCCSITSRKRIVTHIQSEPSSTATRSISLVFLCGLDALVSLKMLLFFVVSFHARVQVP